VSKSDRLDVSREALETMRNAVTEVRAGLHGEFPNDAYEQGRLLERLATRLLDVELALDALCSRRS